MNRMLLPIRWLSWKENRRHLLSMDYRVFSKWYSNPLEWLHLAWMENVGMISRFDSKWIRTNPLQITIMNNENSTNIHKYQYEDERMRKNWNHVGKMIVMFISRRILEMVALIKGCSSFHNIEECTSLE